MKFSKCLLVIIRVPYTHTHNTSAPYPPPLAAAGELLLRNAAFRPAQKAQEQERRLVEASALEQVPRRGFGRWGVGWVGKLVVGYQPLKTSGGKRWCFSFWDEVVSIYIYTYINTYMYIIIYTELTK